MSDLFKSDLVGGDRKVQVLAAKKKVDDILEGFWKDFFAGTFKNQTPTWGAGGLPAGLGAYFADLSTVMTPFGFTAATATSADTMKEEVEFFYEIHSILNKSIGALGGEANLKEEVGEEADTLREQIKLGLQPNGDLPYGPQNRRLAQHVYASLKAILKDHGGDFSGSNNAVLSKLIQTEADIVRALNNIAAAMSNRSVAAPAAGGRKKYRL